LEQAPERKSTPPSPGKTAAETPPRQAETRLPPQPSPTTDATQLFAKLEEMLLTIDWEVNSENILKAQDILGKLVKARGWVKTSLVGRVTEQMDKVLSSMLESPESSSVSAPSQLKIALETIKNSETPGEAVDENLQTTLGNLRALLVSDEVASQRIKDDLQATTPVASIPTPGDEPSFDLGLEMEGAPRAEPPAAKGETISEETARVLGTFTSAITQSIKLLTPMEGLFASRPAMAKLHAATKRLKENLASLEELFRKTFSADYTSYIGLGTLNSWLESQLEVIKKCVIRIGKMEKLFGKTAGYEKLHARSRKIRKILENQLDALTIVVGGTPVQHQFDLTGEYPAIIRPAPPREPEAPPAAVSAVATPVAMVDKCLSLTNSLEQEGGGNPQEIATRIRKTLEKLKVALSGAAVRAPGASAAASAAASFAGHATRCRWDWLLKTSWGGQLVGIAPEQVAYESKSTFPLSSFKNLTFFSLKKLKSMPWRKLQDLFSGELAELDNSVLNDMELEIAKPPTSFPGSTKKKVYLVILYSGSKGKVFLVDAPTEAISLAEDALWSPGATTESDNIAGTLTVYGSTIPVVSID
ncbi:MAG: hypothetical protein RQ753_03580, partial [Desulfurivibrionaceae bacterium]|nr:hypothetical protein [Desulfurivibrionaceae bacterium]